MPYDIFFQPVGDGERGGDAIYCRHIVNGEVQRIIIDGGNVAAGEKMVEFVRSLEAREPVIDHVISSHPDNDHASGLRRILQELTVGTLWIHRLWEHIGEMLPYLARTTSVDSATRTFRGQYPIVAELLSIADERGVALQEPFEGARIGPFTVLSPTLHSYVRLAPQFRRTNLPDVDALHAEGYWLGSVLSEAAYRGGATAPTERETWQGELLRGGVNTAAENETSTVLYGDFGASSVLLTADAGRHALRWACDAAAARRLALSNVTLFQVPHHGSRRNVNPDILDRMLGPKLPFGAPATRSAYVSVPADDAKHPRKMVLNAYRRRGVAVYKTGGTWLRRDGGIGPLRGWEAVQPYAFQDYVEPYD